MNNAFNNPQLDPQLEARIVALVLGEASEFEREELQRLIRERPEVAEFYSTMQEMHGVLQGVSEGELIEADDDWKLPDEKRNVVLAVIRGEATIETAQESVADTQDAGKTIRRTSRWKLTTAVSAVCLLAVCGGLVWLMLPKSRSLHVDLLGGQPADMLFVLDPANPTVKSPATPMLMGGTNQAFQFGDVQESIDSTSAEMDFEDQSSSELALSSIRDTLSSDQSLPADHYARDYSDFIVGEQEFRFDANAAPQRYEADSELAEKSGGPSGADGSQSVQQQFDDEYLMVLSDGALKYDGVGVDSDNDGVPSSVPSFFDASQSQLSSPSLTNETVREVSEPTVAAIKLRTHIAGRDSALEGALSSPASGNDPSGAPVDSYSLSLGFSKDQLPSGYVPAQSEKQKSKSLDLSAIPSPGNDTITFSVQNQGWVTEPFGENQKTREQSANGRGSQTEQGSDDGLSLDFSGSAIRQELAETNSNGNEAEGEIALDGFSRGGERALGESVTRDNLGGARFGGGAGNGQPLSKAKKKSLVTENKTSNELFEGKDSSGEDRELYDKKSEDGPQSSEEFSLPAEPTIVVKGMIDLPERLSAAKEGKQSNGSEADGADRGENSLRLFGRLQFDEKVERARTPALVAGAAIVPTEQFVDQNGDVDSGISMSRIDGGSHSIYDNEIPVSGGTAGLPLSRFYKYNPPNGVDDSKSMYGLAAKRTAFPAGLEEKSAAEEAFSTFSLHVSDVSFKLAMSELSQGTWPESAKVRIEEFVNAFDYVDPLPRRGEKVACAVEQSIHPFLQQRNMLRVSMRTASTGRSSSTPLRLTLLLDNSGSMERIDRQQTVRRAFSLLAQQLTPIDQVTLLSFARQPRLLADKVSGTDVGRLVDLVEQLPSEGGTNIEAALQLAFEKAREQQVPGAQNRIVLLTDGAVNLGDAAPENLSQMVVSTRNAGIAFDAAGISADGLNDEVLEALTRKGDGRYYLLDSLESVDDGFARQIAGALRPAAKNVKVQVEFNPKRVGRYKLLGFEKHILNKEDFRNDKVDAAEMAAAEAGVAVYQFEAKADGEGDVGSVSVRFRDLATGQMVENRWPIPYDADVPRADVAAPSLRIATSAALLAAKLRGDALGETVNLKSLSQLVSDLPSEQRNNQRVRQLQQMITQARQLSGE